MKPDDRDSIRYFAELIKKGLVVAFPTETVYGLGANAFDENAVKKIFELKKRPADNPLIVHVESIEQLSLVAEDISELERRLFKTFSPGPLTVLLKRKKSIPDIVTAGSTLVAVRIPNHPVALALLRTSGVPIAAPSANISGKPSATHHDHVIAAFGASVPVIQAGSTTYGVESTVVVVNEKNHIVILRQGAIAKEDIQKEFPETKVVIAGEDDAQLKASPGTRYKHYSPKGNITLLPLGKEGEIVMQVKQYIDEHTADTVAILCSDEIAAQVPTTVLMIRLGSESKLETIARNLYAALLECDDKNITHILAQSFPEKGIGRTVMERLRRAAVNE